MSKTDLLVQHKIKILASTILMTAKKQMLYRTDRGSLNFDVIAQQDAFGRVIDYLRVSVTDRCNEKCLYCMPEGYQGWACGQDRMGSDEIIAVVEAAAKLGFRKIRLTGGEPLVRRDLVEIARCIWNLPGIEVLGISTNGVMLEPVAKKLKQAGVRAVNVSLDALDPSRYHKITGGNVFRVLDGLAAAREADFEVIKLNCVLLRGINESELLPLADYAAAHGHPLRFIELMPLAGPFDFGKHFLSLNHAVRLLGGWETLESVRPPKLGHGPARYWHHKPSGAKIGLIGALSFEHFCETCNKLRLTSDGKLRPCLGREGEIDLRSSGSPERALRAAIASKPADHTFADGKQSARPMTAIGG